MKIYQDKYIAIYQEEDHFRAEWISADLDPKYNFLQSKLIECVLNRVPGSWYCKNEDDMNTLKGMRTFVISEKTEGVLEIKWKNQ